MWIESSGVFCSISTGFGKRISLGRVNKYPAPEYCEKPELACVCYQRSGGRGVIETLCYSNLYPAEYKGLITEAIHRTLGIMERLTGQKYPRGIKDDSGLDVDGFAADLEAGVIARNEEQEKAIEELFAIAKSNPSGLKRRRKQMQALHKKIHKERQVAHEHRLLQRQFNAKTACKAVEITGGGTFNALNEQGTDITPIYDVVKRKLE